MEIECDRIRPLDSGQQRALLRTENRQRSERAVDMKPGPFFGAYIGKRAEVVDGSDAGAAGGADDEERTQPACPVRRDSCAQGA